MDRAPRPTAPTALEALTALIELVLPGDCAGCGAPAAPWCADCAAHLGRPRWVPLPAAPRSAAFGRSATRSPTAPSTVPSAALPVLAAGRYTGPLRSAVLRYKERGRRDLAGPLSELLGPLLDALPIDPPSGGAVLVPAPSRRAAARARGGDHVLRLCRLLARPRPRVEVAAALRHRAGVRDSVGLDAADREANLAGRILVRPAVLPGRGAPVVLVDDVLTTGATLRACRAALAEQGRPVIAAVVLCDATRPGG